MATIGSAKATLVNKIDSLTSSATAKDTIFLAKALKENSSLNNFVWQGNWAATTEYSIDDVVASGGNTYMCKAAHTSGSSFALGSNWDMMAGAGTNGTDGADGTNFANGGTIAGELSMSDNVISQAELKDYSETVVAISTTCDLSTGNVFTKSISGAVTLTFTNPPVSGKAGAFTLICTMSGSPAITWPAGVDWSAATAPALSTTGKDIFTFLTTDGGTTWYGFTAGQEMS